MLYSRMRINNNILIIIFMVFSVSCIKEELSIPDDNYIVADINGKRFVGKDTDLQVSYYEDEDIFEIYGDIMMKGNTDHFLSITYNWYAIEFSICGKGQVPNSVEKCYYKSGEATNQQEGGTVSFWGKYHHFIAPNGWIVIDAITPDRIIGRFELKGSVDPFEARNGEFKLSYVYYNKRSRNQM